MPPRERTPDELREIIEAQPRDTATGCWIWSGSRRNGYGVLGHNRYAHRIAWTVFHGPIPAGAGHHGTCVCHACDNRACVNPDHLFLGSQRDNLRDMWAKGRASTPAQRATYGNARLTTEQVREIRRLYDEGGLSQREIGERFGIEQTTVSGIVRRVRWPDID